MKMRKILPLVILAVGALFLLSGCDALLDAIFAKNQISVDVQVSNAYYNDWYYGAGSVTLNFYDLSTGSTTTVVSGRTGYDYTSSHFVFTFTKLEADTFAITAFYNSAYYADPASNNVFYDPSGAGHTSIAMPFTNSGDSTGHSIDLTMYF